MCDGHVAVVDSNGGHVIPKPAHTKKYNSFNNSRSTNLVQYVLRMILHQIHQNPAHANTKQSSAVIDACKTHFGPFAGVRPMASAGEARSCSLAQSIRRVSCSFEEV